MWPRAGLGPLYEPLIRARRASGARPQRPIRTATRSATRTATCWSSARARPGSPRRSPRRNAARASILCDEQAELGGSLLDGPAASDRRRRRRTPGSRGAWRRSRGNPRVQLLPRTTAFGYFPHNIVGLVERLTDHLADAAPGAAARAAVAGARARGRARDRRDRAAAGVPRQRPARASCWPARRTPTSIATACARAPARCSSRRRDGAYRAALDLQAAGVEIAAIADLRAGADGALADAARPRRHRSHLQRDGARHARRPACAASASRVRQRGASARELSCDLVLMSGGWTPSVHLFSQSRGQLAWSDAARAFVPRHRPSASARPAPAAASTASPTRSRDGAAGGRCGRDGLRTCGKAPRMRGYRRRACRAHAAPAGASPRASAGPKAFVDFQNDVTARDLALAAREGFRSIEHVKRYTTTGMATDQGKTSNLNALGIVAGRLGQVRSRRSGSRPSACPTRRSRSAASPATARGDLFDPVRTTPMHDWASRSGAVFEDVGQWKRARYFPRGGEDMHAAVARECRAVRAACGMFDASTLGKIEVVGPDAAEFLNRLYVNNFVEPRSRPRALRHPAARGRLHLRRRRHRAHWRPTAST